jgi:hypothetical protein
LQGLSRARRATASINCGLSAVRRATINTRAERYGGTVAPLELVTESAGTTRAGADLFPPAGATGARPVAA